jgi:hypothetical protein
MIRTCEITDCSNVSTARGWCAKHYARWLRHGSPYRKTRRNSIEAFDFIKMVLVSSTDNCLLWPFKTTVYGYASIRVNDRLMPSHRYVCELAHGPAPQKKMDAAHKCGVRACMNPKHIRWATRSENELDKVDHGLSNRGTRQWCHKLSEAQVSAIKRDHANGKPLAEIYQEYPVAQRTIRDIVNGVTWKWLTAPPWDCSATGGQLPLSPR